MAKCIDLILVKENKEEKEQVRKEETYEEFCERIQRKVDKAMKDLDMKGE